MHHAACAHVAQHSQRACLRQRLARCPVSSSGMTQSLAATAGAAQLGLSLHSEPCDAGELAKHMIRLQLQQAGTARPGSGHITSGWRHAYLDLAQAGEARCGCCYCWLLTQLQAVRRQCAGSSGPVLCSALCPTCCGSMQLPGPTGTNVGMLPLSATRHPEDPCRRWCQSALASACCCAPCTPLPSCTTPCSRPPSHPPAAAAATDASCPHPASPRMPCSCPPARLLQAAPPGGGTLLQDVGAAGPRLEL
jgi:hypothetical protein